MPLEEEERRCWRSSALNFSPPSSSVTAAVGAVAAVIGPSISNTWAMMQGQARQVPSQRTHMDFFFSTHLQPKQIPYLE